MSLPVYQHINLQSFSLEELGNILHPDINLHHPVVFNLKTMDLDQQREVVGLVENYFVGHNISFKFPYPVYFISDHEISITKVPLVNETSELPKFYTQRESKMNVKESHIAHKNSLIQIDIKSCDASTNTSEIEEYSNTHRIIYEQERERKYYLLILEGLEKVTK